MKRTRVFAAILTVLCVSCATPYAQAGDLFAVTVTPGAITDTWEYALYNNDLSGKIRVIDLYMVWDEFETPGEDIIEAGCSGPVDWDFTTDGSSYAWWVSTAGGAEQHPLPGESLSGFVTQSADYLPMFWVGYYSTEDPGSVLNWPADGPPASVQAVPEPGSLAVLLAGLACLGPAVRRFRR